MWIMVGVTCALTYFILNLGNHAGFPCKNCVEIVSGNEKGIINLKIPSNQMSDLEENSESDLVDDSKMMHFCELQNMDLQGFDDDEY